MNVEDVVYYVTPKPDSFSSILNILTKVLLNLQPHDMVKIATYHIFDITVKISDSEIYSTRDSGCVCFQIKPANGASYIVQ